MTKLEELKVQLEEAKKGKAKVDKEYVEYKNDAHLFDYKIDFAQFMDDIVYIINKVKN